MSPIDSTPFTSLENLLVHSNWPVMPEAGQALIRTLNDDDADIHRVCQIIAKDPALTTHLVRMANSAMFGLSGTVDTLERAVNVVGLGLVRTRALSLCMARICQFPVGIDRIAFWHYSLRCAQYAQWLAKHSAVDEQVAWLCGMMLRLGELTLANARPGCLLQIEAQPIAPAERWARQRRIVGFTEGEVTAELARCWDFPASLVSALRHCAQPQTGGDFSRLACVLHLAARLADGGELNPGSLEHLPGLLMHLLDLDPAGLLAEPPAEDALDISFFG